MTPTQFRSARKALGLTAKGLAHEMRVGSLVTIYSWDGNSNKGGTTMFDKEEFVMKPVVEQAYILRDRCAGLNNDAQELMELAHWTGQESILALARSCQAAADKADELAWSHYKKMREDAGLGDCGL